MGKGGEATFLASPSEIQRIALTKQKEYELLIFLLFCSVITMSVGIYFLAFSTKETHSQIILTFFKKQNCLL